MEPNELASSANHVPLSLSSSSYKIDMLINYKSYLISIFVSLAISIGLQMILPWPFGLIAVLGIFMVYPLVLRHRAVSRMGGPGTLGGGFFGQGQGFGYVCLTCGNRFKGATCPRCGSKIKRAEF
jgi:hypothetical protein